MTGLMKTDFDIRTDQQTLSRINGLEKIQTPFRIFDGVQGLHRFLAGTDILPVLPFGFHFLDMGAVPQHDPAEFKGGPGADDLALKTLLDHFGDQSRMVHVGMGQQDILKCLGSILWR